jgi:alkanesulfonate monooxygenase SsuD/methylene tetrahydromethanopterin reductase-like flavin-dependent oxidoreductase (luciferase family)
MLNVTGRLTDGTSTWCTGVNTLRTHIVPVLGEAAAAVDRPAPRVVAAFPICVTDDVDAARARASKVFAIYTNLPSYRAMMDLEGVADPAGLAIVGTEAEVRDQLAEVAAAGVTDLNAGVFPGNPEENDRTRAVLRDLARG